MDQWSQSQDQCKVLLSIQWNAQLWGCSQINSEGLSGDILKVHLRYFSWAYFVEECVKPYSHVRDIFSSRIFSHSVLLETMSSYSFPCTIQETAAKWIEWLVCILSVGVLNTVMTLTYGILLFTPSEGGHWKGEQSGVVLYLDFPLLNFYPRQELPSGIVVSGKKVVHPMGGQVVGRAGGWASRFCFRSTLQKLLYVHLWNLTHIWALWSSCAFWGSYCHSIYSFPVIMKNRKKIIFLSGPELLNGCLVCMKICHKMC